MVYALTPTIKTVFPKTAVCIISNHAVLEYREAALRNGADHFMVKGESTEAQIVHVVDSLFYGKPA